MLWAAQKGSLVEGWMPPTRENYETILFVWQLLYPAVSPYNPPNNLL